MSAPLPPGIRRSLEASRARADRVLAAAENQAQVFSRMASETDQALADARLARLAKLRTEVEQHQERIEAAYVAMAEAMASVARRLTEVALDADFGIPTWSGGFRTAFELKLTETREMTVRIARDPDAPGRSLRGSRIAAIDDQER